MTETTKTLENLLKNLRELQQRVEPATDAEKLDRRARSVHGSLAIEEPDVTLDEVREVFKELNCCA